jgi:phage tail sheath protein FI
MPQYLSPGVYVEEIDAGPQPIEGVSTSVCGAVGVTAFGPSAGKPVLCTSFLDYMRTFGGFLTTPDAATVNNWSLNQADGGAWWSFPLSIKAFFDNGGQQLYVKRVVSSKATASNTMFGHGLTSPLAADAKNGATQLKLTSVTGITSGNKVQIFQGDGAQVGGDFTVSAFDDTGSTVTVQPAIAQALSATRGDFVQIFLTSKVPVPAAEQTVQFKANAVGQWSNNLWVKLAPMVGNTFNILFDPGVGPATPDTTTVTGPVTAAAGPPPTTVIPVAQATGFPDGDLAANDHVTIGGTEYTITAVDGANKKITVAGDASNDATIGAVVKRLRVANKPTVSKVINVWGAAALYSGAIVEVSNLAAKETFTVVSVNGTAVTLSGATQKQYYEGHKMRLIEAQVTAQYRPDGGDVVEEIFPNLRLINDGTPSYLVALINTTSNLIQATAVNLASNADLSTFPAAPVTGGWANLTGGDDKISTLRTDDFVGVDGGSGKRTGIQALEDITDISICMVPGMWAQDIQSALIVHCETLKSRVAILDPPDGLDITGIQTFRSPIDSKYAALYYPWVVVRDPSVSLDVHVAPSGHMAGIYARVDNDRGVWKAPANEVIQGITQIAQDVNKREQDLLNPRNINCLRFFPDRGNRVWGARIVTSDSSWKYINVRRLFIYIEQSIDVGTQWVVFEPNDEALWARVRQSISNFLETTWRQGALMGTKASEAFFVKCDSTTMTQDDIDNGRLICLIGIAPVKPAEFVIFRVQQKTLDQTRP